MSDYHPVVEMLQSRKAIAPEQLEALHEQLLAARDDMAQLKELLLRHKVATESEYLHALAEHLDLDFRENFEDVPVNLVFTQHIPIRYAKRLNFFPIQQVGQTLEVALDDPSNTQPLNDLGRQYQCHVQPVLASRQAVLDLINRSYDQSNSFADNTVEQLEGEEGFENILGVEEPQDLLENTDEEPVKRLVNNLLWQATKEEASDVHIDPSPSATLVRYRLDGILHPVTSFPKQVHVTVVNRIKVMSRLDIAQKALPQDGRTMVLIAGKRIDIRVSTIPTVHGEKVVMRLLYQSEQFRSLGQLALVGPVLMPFREMLKKPGGIILVTGPTGSGKTTTLYAALAEIDHQIRNVVTIEDPVEYKIAGYSQIEINQRIGLSFANALRSVLRQDPDVIMVGEMRDAETAQIAMQAALTGHLVFSTVHTNSAAATITRLIDMGIEPFLISSTILGVLAQRLIRRVCPQCRKSYSPHPEQILELGVSEDRVRKTGGSFFTGQGCKHCRETGYRGRLGVHELLVMTDKVKAAVMESSDANFIQRCALKDGMITLRRDGTSKVLCGLTTPEELLSITADNEPGVN